jgi:hypothetical protein
MMRESVYERIAVVLAVACLTGCLTEGPVEPLAWRVEEFGLATHPLTATSKASAVARDGLLLVSDTGTQQGDMVVQQRSWSATPEAGAAAEARVRVIACNGLAGVMLGFSDGVHEDLLTLYADRIELHQAKRSYAMDTTNGFHVYRVDIRGTNVSVGVDGVTVIDAPGQFTGPAHEGRNRVSFGAGSSAATGEALWDWVRWTVRPVLRGPEERDVPDAEHRVVYKRADRYACFPDLTMEPDTGRLFTAFAAKGVATHYETADTSRIVLESRDTGDTWNAVPAVPPTAIGDMPAVFTARDGAKVRFGQNWRRWFPLKRLPEFKDRYDITYSGAGRGKEEGTFAVTSGGHLERSEDGGRTWRRTEIAGLDTYASSSSPWSNAQLPDGTVLRAFMVRRDAACRGKVCVAITRDGLTAEVVPVMGDPDNRLTFTEETLLHATSGGALWLLTRVHGDGDFLWQAVSKDGGRTWTSRKTEIDAGQSPPSGLVRLDDGRLVLVYGYRKEPFGLRAVVSEDEGLTWRTDQILVLRRDGDGFDLGYPRAVKLPDGRVLAVYYYATDDQVRHIACTRFAVPKLKRSRVKETER